MTWMSRQGFGRNCLCFTSTVPVFFRRGISQDTRWPMQRHGPSMNETSSLHQATSYADREMFPSSIRSASGSWFSLLTLERTRLNWGTSGPSGLGIHGKLEILCIVLFTGMYWSIFKGRACEHVHFRPIHNPALNLWVIEITNPRT